MNPTWIGRRTGLGVLFCGWLLLAGCGDDEDTPQGGERKTVWSFEDGTLQGFVVDQTDFEPATRGGLDYAVEALPAPLSGKGLRVTADNKSDDQWSYVKRALGQAEGVAAGKTYLATIAIRMASNTPSGCVGVGGSPDGVTYKGGVVQAEPVAVKQKSGYVGFSALKGEQTQIGGEAVSLGTNGSSGTNCGGKNPWEILSPSGSMSVTAPASGQLWLYVGGDSGFEAAHTIYYDEISLTLTPQ